MRAFLVAAALTGMVVATAMAETRGQDGAKEFAPGQRQTKPGEAKKFAPGQRQKEPGQAKKFAPGQQNGPVGRR
jgi:hypothetical protein